MARYNPIKNSCVAGEFSPRLEGRDDLTQYFQSLRQTRNGIVLPHGGFKRRSGTRYVASVKTASKRVRLIPFLFSTAQAYMCEFGDQYVRFYTNEGQLESGGSPVEVSSPFLEAEVMGVQFAQNADVLYLVHPNHPPYKLQRTSATTFTLTEVEWSGGRSPLRAANVDTSLTVTTTGSGPYTLTWSSDIGLDSSVDVGRYVRIGHASNEWFQITAVSSGAVATADFKNTTGSPTTSTAQDDWALGLFSDTEGPQTVSFHEGRLAFGGAANDPDRWVASVSDSFEDFELEDPSVTDAENADKSISRRVVSRQVNAVRWITSVAEAMALGTSGAEFRVRGANEDFLTPAGTITKPATARGAAALAPVVIDGQVVFVQRNQRKLREFTFDINSDGFISRDISILAEHILESGVVQLEYQQDPDSVIWALRSDGQLIGFTFEREQQVIGAHRHVVGGSFQEGDAVIESIGVIQNPEESADQLWLAVKRTVNGSTVRYIEFMEDEFRPDLRPNATDFDRITALNTAFYVDSGLSLDSPVTITGISAADPGVVTTDGAHGFSNGDRIRIRDVKGCRLVSPSAVDQADGFTSAVNEITFLAANVTSTTFELTDLDGNDVDLTSAVANAYIAGGTARKETTTISGLSHLEGEAVDVLVDGAAHPQRTVSSGSITLTRNASIVHVGLPFDYYGETQRFTGGGQLGTDQGQNQRIQRVVARIHDTLGGEWGVGPAPAEFEPMLFRSGDDRQNFSPPLFSGDKDIPVAGGWTLEPTVYWRQTQPLPMTVLAIMPRMESNER